MSELVSKNGNLLVIYNQESGPSYLNYKSAITSFFAKKNTTICLHNVTTDGPFQDFDPQEYDRIIVVGGDGTLKEVANWIIKAQATTPLAIIPKGTGNVVAQSLGIPLNINKALEIALHGRPRKIDAGRVNNREYFLLAAGMGFDAKVIRNTSRRLKRFVGFFAYLYSLLVSLFDLNANKVFIVSDEMRGSVRTQSVFVSNINRFYNLNLVPGAEMDDGYLNVSVFSPVSIRDFFDILIKVLAGQYDKSERYTFFKTKRVYMLPFHKHMPMQIDGELVDLAYMDIDVVEGALNIITDHT